MVPMTMVLGTFPSLSDVEKRVQLAAGLPAAKGALRGRFSDIFTPCALSAVFDHNTVNIIYLTPLKKNAIRFWGKEVPEAIHTF